MAHNATISKGVAVVLSESARRLRLVNIPPGVISWKIKARHGTFAQIYLRYRDGIEGRALVPVGDGEMEPGFIMFGWNRRASMK